MLTAGTILYFTPFYFKNGATSKDKYFIVLKEIEDRIILASLPSSQIFLPHRIAEDHGCIEVPEGCINCYLFTRGRVIGVGGFSFPLLTALYGQQIDTYEKAIIQQQYPVEGFNYVIVDQLLPQEHETILDCLRQSASVSKKHKRIL